eukprot:6473741-Amphidinium_carterae.1
MTTAKTVAFTYSLEQKPQTSDAQTQSKQKRKRVDEGADEANTAKKGGGGSWRTFVHTQSVGQQLPQSLQGEYWQMKLDKPEEFKQYEEIGKLAADLHRAGMATYPAHSRRAQYNRAGERDFTQRAAASIGFADDSTRDEYIAAVMSGRAVETPKAVASKSFKAEVDVLVRDLAKPFLRSSAEREASAREAVEGIMAAKLSENILVRRKQLTRIPSAKWIGIPHSCPALSVAFVAEEAVPTTWTDDNLSSHGSSIKLAQDWRKQHKGIQDQPALWKDPGVSKRLCQQDHFCHCKASGLQVQILHSRFRAWLTRLCTDSVIHNHALSGQLILCWLVQDPSHKEDPNNTTSQQRQVLATHVSLYYLRPWRPTFLVLEPDVATKKLLLQNFSVDVAVQTRDPHKFRVSSQNGALKLASLWHWLDELSRDGEIHVQPFVLSDRKTPQIGLATFSAFAVSVPWGLIWSGLESERRVHRDRRPPSVQLLERLEVKTHCDNKLTPKSQDREQKHVLPNRK